MFLIIKLVFILLIVLAPAQALERMGSDGKWTSYRLGAVPIYVIEQFFTDCGPCRRNVPNVNKLVERLRAQGLKVEVFHLTNIDSDEKLQVFREAYKPNHGILRDLDYSFMSGLKNVNPSGSVPATYVMDENQNVLYHHEGTWDEAASKEIEAAVIQALGAVRPQRESRREFRRESKTERHTFESRLPSAGSRSDLE